jgi:hypothetical protein
MTCLSVVQDVCKIVGITAPNAAISSSDQQIKQMVALLNREGKALAARIDWEALKTEATFTTVAAETQDDVETLAPGYKYIHNHTIWNRTLNLPVYGPLPDYEWQSQKASNVSGPYSQYRIRGGNLLFIPAPSAGDTCAFEYQSRYWVRDSGSTTTRASYTDDTDVARLDEDLITLGLIWRWREAKGLSYAEDFAEYERQVADAIARDGTKPVLRMESGDREPGVMVPEGSWNL